MCNVDNTLDPLQTDHLSITQINNTRIAETTNKQTHPLSDERLGCCHSPMTEPDHREHLLKSRLLTLTSSDTRRHEALHVQ